MLRFSRSNLFVRLSLDRWRFSVRSYSGRDERQVTLSLRSEYLPAAFLDFYAKNRVFRLRPLTAHLPYPPLYPQ